MRRRLKNFFYFIIIGLIIVGLAFFFYFRKKNIMPAVSTAEVKKTTISQLTSSSGNLIVVPENIVYAPLAGKLAVLKVGDGESVSKGQLIAVYDQISLKAAVSQAQSALAVAQKTKADLEKNSPTILQIEAAKALIEQKKELLRLAKEALDDSGTSPNLTNYNAASTAYYDALANLEKLEKTRPTKGDIEAADQAVVSAKDLLASASHNLKQSVITAPTAGILTLASGTNNALLNQGSYLMQGQEIFRIASSNNLLFRAEIDEINVVKLKEGMETKIALDAYPDKVFQSTLKSINSQTHTTSTGGETYYAYAEINQKDEGFRAGMAGQADFVEEKLADVLALPNEAILEKDDKKMVFTITGDGKIVTKEIAIGISNDEFSEIKSGLNLGEKVVTGDIIKKIKEGQRVREK